MNYFKDYVNAFITEEDGAEIMEYAIVILVVVGLVTVLMALRDSIKGKISETQTKLETDNIG